MGSAYKSALLLSIAPVAHAIRIGQAFTIRIIIYQR